MQVFPHIFFTFLRFWRVFDVSVLLRPGDPGRDGEKGTLMPRISRMGAKGRALPRFGKWFCRLTSTHSTSTSSLRHARFDGSTTLTESQAHCVTLTSSLRQAQFDKLTAHTDHSGQGSTLLGRCVSTSSTGQYR